MLLALFIKIRLKFQSLIKNFSRPVKALPDEMYYQKQSMAMAMNYSWGNSSVLMLDYFCQSRGAKANRTFDASNQTSCMGV